MNLDFVEAVHLGQQIGVILKNRPAEHTDIVVVPPFVDLRSVTSIVDSERIGIDVGAQHVNANDNGAFTGEISTSMLKRLGVTWVLVGHSERRTMYHMDDAVVALTLRAVVANGLNAVLCVGEAVTSATPTNRTTSCGPVAQRPRRTRRKVHRAGDGRLRADLGHRHRADRRERADPAMTRHIRSVMGAMGLAGRRVLYGGSVNAENAASIVTEGQRRRILGGRRQPQVAESFLAIIQACDDCYAGKR
jgi:triosephosphate isomerase